MAIVFHDRVQDTTTSSGTGNLVITGTAGNGYKTIADKFVATNQGFFVIIDTVTNEWECSLCTFDGTDTLTRNTLVSSSTNSPIDFAVDNIKNIYHVAPSSLFSDVVAHVANSVAHGASGAVVGTTNEQTLTNKTLTLPKINEDVTLTATATEINILDGASITTGELNSLDGILVGATELNALANITGEVQGQLDDKQETLVSGTNIKTINNNSLLGSGNIIVTAAIDDGDVTNAKLAFDGGALGFRNKLINGGMQVAQRGATVADPTTTNFYTLDRWGALRSDDSSGITVVQSSELITGIGTQYTLKLRRTAGNSSTQIINLWNTLESKDSYSLVGKTVVMSFYAKSGANYSGGNLTAAIYYGTGTDQRGYAMTGITAVVSETKTLTTSMQRFTVSGAVPTNATQLAVCFNWTPSGTAGAADEIILAAVQLEEGSTATPFENRLFEAELALCQRYYYRVGSIGDGVPYGHGYNTTTTTAEGYIPFPVTMRISPSALEQSGTETHYGVNYENTNATCSAVPILVGGNSKNGGSVRFTVASGLTVGQGSLLRSKSASGYLGWSAEL